MTAPADIPLRDQQLDDEGHDDNCAVWNGEGFPCSGPPVCNATGQEFPRPPPRRKPAALEVQVAPPDGSVTLLGPTASAYLKWQAAMGKLRQSKAQYEADGAAAQAAHNELVRLVTGG